MYGPPYTHFPVSAFLQVQTKARIAKFQDNKVTYIGESLLTKGTETTKTCPSYIIFRCKARLVGLQHPDHSVIITARETTHDNLSLRTTILGKIPTFMMYHQSDSIFVS